MIGHATPPSSCRTCTLLGMRAAILQVMVRTDSNVSGVGYLPSLLCGVIGSLEWRNRSCNDQASLATIFGFLLAFV